MTNVKILIEGYAKEIENGWLASSTTTLVQKDGVNIIVDPGINRKLLLDKLAELNFSPQDIDYVLMTHFHPDHNYLAAIFENAKALDDELIYENDKETKHRGVVPRTDLKIIQTPGHEKFHASLVVPTQEGVYVIAGDVFWWRDNEKQKTDRDSLMQHQDPFVKDKDALTASREKILEIADYIIPGHGKVFKVEK